MATVVLPENIQAKLDDLALRMRRLRLIRGFSTVVLAAVTVLGLALIADAWLELPSFARAGLLVTWIIAVAAAGWVGLVRPWRHELRSANLAAAVEEQYPRLSERLTSTVELAEHAEVCHGSPRFIEMLVRETDLKTRAIDFLRVAPRHATEWLGASAVAALLVLIAPAILAPDNYLGLGRRFLMPWDNRPAVLPFAIAVKPGSGFAAKGRPLTFDVELVPTQAEVTFPSACTLVLTPKGGKAQRLRMAAGDKRQTYRFRLEQLENDLSYWIEAGANYTDMHKLEAIEPVELAEGNPTLTSLPPDYARTVLDSQTVHGLVDLGVLQHSRLTLDCRFTIPAAGAKAIWTPATSGADAVTAERLPLVLGADGQSGRLEWPARSSGRLQLFLDAAHGITTVLPSQQVIVTLDQPPVFQRLAGFALEPRALQMSDALPIEVTLTDDFGVAAAKLEYRINDGAVQHEPIPLSGQGTRSATGQLSLRFDGKVQDGDIVRYRIKAIDTRSVPEAKLGPNVAVFPANDRWCELRVLKNAGKAREQEIEAQREGIDKRLKALVERLDSAIRSTYSLRQNVERNSVPRAEQDRKLQELAEEHRTTAKQLGELAREAHVMAGLQALAERLHAVAEQEMRMADEALNRATQTADQPRADALRQADDSLTKAREKLEGLVDENRKLAEARRDQAKIQDLAERERDLAERVEKAATAEDKAKLEAEQKALNEELQRLAEQSETLREALRAAQAEQARQLAGKAKDLAKAERDLDEAITAAEKDQNVAKFADLAKRQQELADQAKRLAEQTRIASQAGKTEPLRPDAAAKAADDLRQGDPDAAKTDQDKSAEKLAKLAKDLQKSIDLARDPREAALQLSRLQEANRHRLQDRSGDRDTLQSEEEAIRQAAARIPVADQQTAAKREQKEAVDQARQAADALKLNDPRSAETKMQKARQALDKMAQSLPTLEQRQKQARDEVARLRKQQDEISAQAEKAAKTANSKEAQSDTAKKQADVAERIARLDAPNQDDRKERARQAASAALDDLLNNRLADQSASQADARRALERLEEALAGQKPAGELAAALADRQRELAKQAAQPDTDPARQRDLQQKQEKLAQDVQNLKPTEAPIRQAEAKDAVIQANKAVRDAAREQAVPQMQAAADKLQQLADQLNGGENNADRAERLARRQEQIARDTSQGKQNDADAKRQANQMAEEAKQVRAGDQAGAEKQQALDALNKTQRTQAGTPAHQQAQHEAAQALRRLADKLNDQLGKDNVAEPTAPNAAALAQQQRELAKQTAAAQKQPAASQPPALNRVAEQQRQLQQQAAQLPSESAPQALQQARQAMNQAEQALAKQDATEARQQQLKAAQALEQAAQQSAAQQAAKQAAQRNPPAAPGLPNREQVEQARDLAQQQRALRDQLREMTGERVADPAADAAQKELANQTQDLAKSLRETARQAQDSRLKQSTDQAAQAAQQAKQAMDRALQSQGNDAAQARQQAADALERAGGQADQANQSSQQGEGRASPNGQPAQISPAQTGQSLQDAQGQMNQAQNQLGQGQSQAAQQSMQQAAQALQQAAQQMGQNQSGQQGQNNGQPAANGQPAQGAGPPQGVPNAGTPPKELQQYAGKPWGELPGELRTKILQEMRSQYGDDYARVIKLYFEQIAERK